jgi:hypothetical protein
MKISNFLKWTLGLVLVSQLQLSAQEADENPEYVGDNFSLEAALEVFKNSDNIEDFEKKLNEEKQSVNNLDLDENGETDYISVESMMEGDNHNVVLFTFVGDNDRQDIAVIEIEKTGAEEAVLQILGDEALYADNTIVEPVDVSEQGEKGQGPAIENAPVRIVVNVWTWRPIRFIFSPGYRVWVSPYKWRVYPKWWKPWKPVHYKVFHTRCAPHRVVYHRTTVHRVVRAHKVYHPHRKSSTVVVKHGRKTTVVHKNKKGNVKTKTVKHGKRK